MSRADMNGTTTNASNRGKHVIGLVGGIASGKTTVARMFEEEGARRVDADRLAGEVLQRDDVQERIRTEFGPEFVAGGTVNRSMLADVVFEDEAKMKRLNGLIHPHVIDRIQEEIETFREAEGERVLVLDVPLLVETDLHELCDSVVFLDVPEAERKRRVAEERGWSGEELRRRESFQAELDLKRHEADYTINTDQREKRTRKRVRRILSELINPSSSGELE